MRMRRVAGRLPLGLIGMVVLVAALDIAMFRVDRFTVDQAESWRFKGEWARGGRAAGAEILIFGDSLMEFGVLPGVIGSQAGLGAVNLAVHDGSPASSLVLLRRALAAGARPRGIVVDFMPHQLARDLLGGGFTRSWPALATPAEAARLAVAVGDHEFFATAMAGRLLGCLAARHEVREAIAALVRGEPPVPKQDVALLRRHWHANGGAQVIPGRVSRPVGPVEGLFPSEWVLDPAADASVRAFLELAASHRIPVYWLVPPIRPDAREWRDRMGLDDPYFAYVADRVAESGAVMVLDARDGGFAAGWFADAVHLKRPGAEALSRALAVTLSAPFEPDATVILAAAPGESPPAEGVEDLDQTRAALRR